MLSPLTAIRLGFFLVLVSFAISAQADADLAQKILNAKSPHEALGIRSGASKEEAEKAYKSRMRVFFLAANLGDKVASDVLAKLNDTRDYFNDKPSNWAKTSRASGPQGPTSGFGGGGGSSQA